MAFLNWCEAKPRAWSMVMPAFDRDREARSRRIRKRRRVTELRPDLLWRLVDGAAPHMRAQLAVEWSTGARVSSILYGCRLCDLILAEGREQITFHETKNGQSVTAALHPAAARVLREYLEWRGRLHDREAPLFLTDRRRPYRDNARSSGGQNKTAYRTARRRAIRSLIEEARGSRRPLLRQGAIEAAATIRHELMADIRLLAQVTQHWFRHLLATTLMASGDIKSSMEQGGWRDVRSLMGYTHDVPDRRRALVNSMPIDTSLTRDELAGRKRGA